ncbi:hypothetical protein KP509_06G045500 [Ceratopteris richardii]|uniref:Uncharacterized protein n=1 Tax=Ceratopteris richardii TaxID=49495 RepID=A0A8T2UMK4_CERRI|nr:hypothetical protein KP509_06G045500 [Ceratopteris richardii]
MLCLTTLHFLLLLMLTMAFRLVVECEWPNIADTILPSWMDAYGKTPNVSLYVCFNRYTCVENGDILNLDDVREEPYVTFTGSDVREEDEYLYVCLDVDSYSPAQPYLRSELHWLVTNINGSIKPYQHVADVGHVAYPYLPPRRNYDFDGNQGVHRYYNLIFKQRRAEEHVKYDGWVRHFGLREFTKINKLGYPLGGVVYEVDYG